MFVDEENFEGVRDVVNNEFCYNIVVEIIVRWIW